MQVSIPVSIRGTMETTFSHRRMHWVNQTIRVSWNKQGTFFRGKIRLQGHGTVVVCAAAALHPKKDGLSGSKRRGGEERRATTLAPPPPEPAPECHTAREPGSQGNTERRAWVRHFQGLGTTTIATTDISTTMVTTIVTTKIETTKNLDHNPDHDRHHDHHHVHHYDHRDEHA